MPWYVRPTLEVTGDGDLVIHYTGPTRTEFIEWASLSSFVAVGMVVTWGWPPHWANVADQPGPILLGLICSTTLIGLLIQRRRQYRPRIDRIDGRGLDRERPSGAFQRLFWADVRRVDWRPDSIDLSTPEDTTYLFRLDDFAASDRPIVSDRIEAALRPRFDLPSEPEPFPPFRWVRVILTALPGAVFLGGAAVLMPYLAVGPLAIAAAMAAGGTVQYILILVLWGSRLSQPRFGSPYLPVRVAPPDLDARPARVKPRSGFALPTFERADDDSLMIRKERIGIDDFGLLFAPILLSGLMILLAVAAILEPTLDRNRGEANPGQIIFFGTLALAAVAWAVVEWRRAYREFDRGTWRIEADRVEFRGHDGTTHSLQSDQIERALWDTRAVRLRGRGAEVRLVPQGIPTEEWQPVRDRLRAILAPRFDLGPLPPPPDAGRRFVRGALPLVVIPAVAVPLALVVPPDHLGPVGVGWFALTVLANG